MAAKAMVPVGAPPCIDRFQGRSPLLHGTSLTSDRRPTNCRSGPWPRKRRFRSMRFLVLTAFGGMAPSYKNRASFPAYSTSGNQAESQNGYAPNVFANPARNGFLMM